MIYFINISNFRLKIVEIFNIEDVIENVVMQSKLYKSVEAMEKGLLQHMQNRKPHGKIAIIAGHFPLTDRFVPAIEPQDKGSFGFFTKYTIEIGAKLLKMAEKSKLHAKIALVIDDHYQVGEQDWYLGIYNGIPHFQEIRRGVEGFFSNFSLPKQFISAGINETNLAFSQTCNAHYFQESRYRQEFNRLFPDEQTGCAAEVNLIYQDLARQGYTDVVGFYPQRCKSPVCHAATEYNAQRINKGNITGQKRESFFLSSMREDEGNLIDSREKMEQATRSEFGGILLHVE